MIGVTILLLAGIGVTCGLIGLADALGIVDLDDPEYRFSRRDEDDG